MRIVRGTDTEVAAARSFHRCLSDSLARELQVRKRAAIEAHVVESVPGDLLRHLSRLGGIVSEHDDARVVVLHRQSPVVFGFDDFVLAMAAPPIVPELNSSAGRASKNTAVLSLSRTYRMPSGSICMTPTSARQTGAPS